MRDYLRKKRDLGRLRILPASWLAISLGHKAKTSANTNSAMLALAEYFLGISKQVAIRSPGAYQSKKKCIPKNKSP